MRNPLQNPRNQSKEKLVTAKVKKVFKYSFSITEQKIVKVGDKIEGMKENIYKGLKKAGFVE